MLAKTLFLAGKVMIRTVH